MMKTTNSFSDNALPFVTVVIPVRNEHRYIRSCLDSVLSQDYPADRLEILLCVSPSEDDTEEIIMEYQEKYNHIHMLKNPKGTISCEIGRASCRERV